MFHDRLERAQLRWRGADRFHGPVSTARRNDGTDSRTSLECDVDRATSPFHRLRLRHERWLQQDERAHIDVMFAEEPCGGAEVTQRHALVQSCEDVRMRRLEADGHLERTAKAVTKRETPG